MSHHTEHRGLQEHSVGPLYPWSVVRIGDRCEQPRQLVTGERGPEFPRDGGDITAYRAARQWICERRKETVEHIEYERLSEEYSFLLPIRHSDGSAIETSVCKALQSELLAAFGGFTASCDHSGAWLDANGVRVDDESVKYTVAVSKGVGREVLVRLLREACGAWGQDCIYLALTASDVEFISGQ